MVRPATAAEAPSASASPPLPAAEVEAAAFPPPPAMPFMQPGNPFAQSSHNLLNTLPDTPFLPSQAFTGAPHFASYPANPGLMGSAGRTLSMPGNASSSSSPPGARRPSSPPHPRTPLSAPAAWLPGSLPDPGSPEAPAAASSSSSAAPGVVLASTRSLFSGNRMGNPSPVPDLTATERADVKRRVFAYLVVPCPNTRLAVTSIEKLQSAEVARAFEVFVACALSQRCVSRGHCLRCLGCRSGLWRSLRVLRVARKAGVDEDAFGAGTTSSKGKGASSVCTVQPL